MHFIWFSLILLPKVWCFKWKGQLPTLWFKSLVRAFARMNWLPAWLLICRKPSILNLLTPQNWLHRKTREKRRCIKSPNHVSPQKSRDKKSTRVIFPFRRSTHTVYLSANLKGFGCFLTLFQFKELPASPGRWWAHEILPHDLCIYLLFWIRFLQVTQVVSKTHVPWDLFATTMLAPYIFILRLLCAPCAHVAHMEQLTATESENQRQNKSAQESVVIGQSWLEITYSFYRIFAFCICT